MNYDLHFFGTEGMPVFPEGLPPFHGPVPSKGDRIQAHRSISGNRIMFINAEVVHVVHYYPDDAPVRIEVQLKGELKIKPIIYVQKESA